jgi:hypothetical protein
MKSTISENIPKLRGGIVSGPGPGPPQCKMVPHVLEVCGCDRQQSIQMTITYADGTVVEALLLSFKEPELRLAVAGYDDVRVFKCIDGVWRTEDGQRVQVKYAWQNDRPAPAREESHFVCSAEVGRLLINNLMNGSETQDGGADPFYVFSTEERRVRVTVYR